VDGIWETHRFAFLRLTPLANWEDRQQNRRNMFSGLLRRQYSVPPLSKCAKARGRVLWSSKLVSRLIVPNYKSVGLEERSEIVDNLWF